MKKTKKPEKKAPAKKPAAKKPAAAKTAPRTKARPAAAKTQPAAEALTRQELAEIAASLNEMKTDISKNVEDKRNMDLLEPEVGDSIDQASQSLDKEILFELSDNERRILRDIDAALRKMEKGTYGLCEHCKKPIQKKRIKALPSARYCMACQSGSERSGS
ncbi:MAG: TraR/DksA family transcriptional regulator [Elusimicrobia bacterium]|nr:TraR/DksA family transcriptional regulator [Elusimicrobiota bacterium]